MPEGLSLAPEAAAANCPETTTPQSTTTTTPPSPPTQATTTTSTEPPTPPTEQTTTTPLTGTQTPPQPQCTYTGTHSGGSNPNWWQSGSQFEYQAYINIPLTASITGGWYIDLTFQNPVVSMQYWSGQAQKMDNQGYRWRLIGWCNQTWSNSIDLTYIGKTNTSGVNTLVKVSKCSPINCSVIYDL